MIQDIMPHHFDNQYIPQKPKEESFVLLYDEGKTLIRKENENISFDLLKNKADIDPNKDFKLTLGYYEGDEEDHNFRFLSLIEISY